MVRQFVQLTVCIQAHNVFWETRYVNSGTPEDESEDVPLAELMRTLNLAFTRVPGESSRR